MLTFLSQKKPLDAIVKRNEHKLHQKSENFLNDYSG